MEKFSSFGRKKKNRPKFDIEWLCSGTFNYELACCGKKPRGEAAVFFG